MRVLQVIHQDPRTPKGGCETYCRHLIDQLHKNNVSLGVFCRTLDQSAKPLKIEKAKEAEYYTVGLTSLPSAKDIFQFVNSYANSEVQNLFLEVLENFKPDIIHVHHLITLSIDIISASVKLGIPIVATLHDYWYFCHRITLTTPDEKPCDGPKNGIKCRACGKSVYNRFPGILLQPGQVAAVMIRNRRLLRELNRCKILYAPSHSLLARYENEGIASHLLVHRPYGISRTPFKKRQMGEELTFGFIGNLSPHKGIEVLLDASRKLNLGPWKLLVFGQGEREYEAKLKNMVGDLPVEFRGKFDNRDIQKTLDQLDVLVVPSLWEENSPLVIHEAYASKIPTVASKIGGLTEIVSIAHGGELFEAGQSSQLANILNSFIQNPNRVKRMQKKIKTIRSIERESEEMMSDYEMLITARSKS